MSKQSLSASATRSTSAMFLVALTYLVFLGSMMVWMQFLWSGSLNVMGDVRLIKSDAAILGLDSALSVAFFVQHSAMIRRPFRRLLAKFVATEYHGANYTIASSLVLLMTAVFWQKSAFVVVAAEGMVMPFLLRTLFVLAILGMCWATYSLEAFDVCGVDPILRKFSGKEPPPPMPLSVSGPYRYVRHPNYFCCLLLFWSCPNLTLDRLLHNVLWSAWVVVGTLLEERDLIMDFGEPYRDYQRNVPMLVPWFVGSVQTEAKRDALKKNA